MPFHRLVAVLVLLAVVPAVAFAQGRGGRPVTPPRAGGLPAENLPRGTSIIRGVVLAADTGTPIRRAQVRASAPGIRESRLATTDAQGRFEFKELRAGRYTLNTSKGGFVSLQYGQRRPSESGTPLELGDDQVMDKLVIALPRGSVISGRVFDEFGEPVANAVVNAMRFGYSAGARRFLPAGGQNSRDTTDDQGQFRLFGLPPGDYIVSANFRGTGREVTDPADEPTGYAPTYFPGTANAGEAQRVRVDISQEQMGINFALIATRLVRITGIVNNSQGAPVTNGAVTLRGADFTRIALPIAGGGSRIDRTGAFRIGNVAPGRYVLQARTGGNTGEMARVDVAVGAEDLDGVVLITRPGATATGQIVTDTQEPPPFTADRVSVMAQAATPQPGVPGGGRGRVSANWTFELGNLFDSRFLRVNAPQGWALKQVLLNGQDITDIPLDFTQGQSIAGLQVVLTQKQTILSGSISDTRGQPATDATVVVFPADEKLWYFQSRYIRAARPDQEGRYQIRGLPAYDDYLIALVQGLEDGQAGDPEFLSSIEATASKLSLNEGESKAADVKLPAPR
jgi:protocatechuate 3,4-dioxygenase beta subunit